MITFLIKHWDINRLSGVQFHMMDLALLLQEEYGVDVCEVGIPRDVVERFKTTGSRYKKMISLVNKGSSTLVTEMNAVRWMFSTNQPEFFDDYQNILVLASNNMEHNKELCYAANPKYAEHLFKYLIVIEDYDTPHTLQSPLPTIKVDRGVYYKQWKEKAEVSNSLKRFWFHYTRPDNYGGREQEHILDRVPENIPYKSTRIYNPEHAYKGLLYTRYYDYMPRLPFEFWHAGKPVYFADVSSGMMRLLNRVIPFHQELFIDPRDFKQWEIDNLLKYFKDVGE